MSSIGDGRPPIRLMMFIYLAGFAWSIPVTNPAADLIAIAAMAQDHASQGNGQTSAEDVLADAERLYGPPAPMEDCSDEQEAAILSGEIIVCRRKTDQSQFRTLPSDAAQTRYAQETMNRGNPPTPDVAGPGIFKGPATVAGLCLIPPCPREPALIIDVTALPQAPPGSDADRISKGLPPLGQENPAPIIPEDAAKPAESAKPGADR